MSSLFKNFFGKSQPEEDLCLVIDLGNGSVSSSLVLFKKGLKPQTFCTTRIPVEIDEKPSSSELERVVLLYLDKAIEKVNRLKLTRVEIKNKKIEKVFVAISSPWFVSRERIIKIEDNKSFFITRKLLKEILDKEVLRFEKMISTKKDELVVIEKTMFDSRINGYDVSDPIDKIASSLDIKVYLSVAKANLVKVLKNHILKYINIDEENIIFHSFPIICLNAIKNIFPNDLNYLHFDITGEVTEINYVVDGFLSKNITLPIGKNFFVRQLAKKTKTDYAQALSLFKSHQLNMVENEESLDIDKLLSDCMEEFEVYLENSLEEFNPNFEIPKKIFVTVDDDLSDFFVNLFKFKSNISNKLEDWKKGLTIVNLDNKILDNFIITRDDIYYDKFILIDSIFFSKFQ